MFTLKTHKLQQTAAVLLTLFSLPLLVADLQAKTIYQCPDQQGRMVFFDGPCQQQALGNKPKSGAGKSHSDTGAATSNAKPPATLVHCDKQHCQDSQGLRYNKLNDDLYLAINGASCKRVGKMMYCR